jgi:hypothetical protein
MAMLKSSDFLSLEGDEATVSGFFAVVAASVFFFLVFFFFFLTGLVSSSVSSAAAVRFRNERGSMSFVSHLIEKNTSNP